MSKKESGGYIGFMAGSKLKAALVLQAVMDGRTLSNYIVRILKKSLRREVKK